ncbi:MAG: IS1634 family transposase, partial [Chloroflexi bacterium]|nr:IS1634 family transposase [Chloroflexota bacterium]
MFLKSTKQKNGRISLSIVEGFRDPVTKKTKHKVIENLGYLDEYLDRYEDPQAHFREVARIRTQKLKDAEAEKEIYLGYVNADELMDEGEDSVKHMGFLPLSSISHDLKIDQFIINRQRSLGMDYSLNDVMQLLVYTRVLSPGSKMASFKEKDNIARPFNCDWYDVYRALDYFAAFREGLLLHLHEQVRINYNRRTNVVFYDVTNYYFEIDQEDEFRRKGFCKHNSRNPLVQMGLLLDEDAIPITYRLFKGNTHDSQTMMPLLQETRTDYGLGRIITVADKGLNSGDNVAFLMSKGDGFIFSQKIRGATQGLQSYVFDKTGYIEKRGIVKQADAWNEKDNQDATVFRMKSRAYPQEFWVTHADDVKRKIPLDVKQIVCYNELYARRQKHKRAELLAKAQNIIENPKRYEKKEAGGALRYVKNIEYDSDTGKCINTKRIPYLDLEKVLEDEKYDGYYAIITSEINMPDDEIVKAYHGLWEIERSFRITKSDLESRPVYVSLESRIEGHFLTCFIALLILRLLSKRLNGNHSPEQIIQSLKKYQICFIKDNVFKATYYDQIIKDLGDALNLKLNNRFLRTGEIKQLVADTKK